MGYLALLDSTCDVYTAGPTGAFTVKAKAALACRLSLVGAAGARSGDERAELLATRQLFWDPGYALPARCQVEIAGVRYNVVHGSEAAPTLPGTGAVLYRSADVVEAEG